MINRESIKSLLIRKRSQIAVRQMEIDNLRDTVAESEGLAEGEEVVFFRERLRSAEFFQACQIELANIAEAMIRFAVRNEAEGIVSVWLYNQRGERYDGINLVFPAVAVTPEIGRTFCLDCLGEGRILNPDPESDTLVRCNVCKGSGGMYFNL